MRCLAALLILLLGGCASVPQQDALRVDSVKAVEAGIEYLGPERGVLPASHFPRAVMLVFPYLPGEIFGNPRPKPLFTTRMQGEQLLYWPVADSLDELGRVARPLTKQWRARGLEISPADTRLARIGTFAFDAATDKRLGAGGFIDPASKDNLILLYVDRACRISGSFELDGKRYRHDIRLPGAGLHWLRVSVEGAGDRRLETHPADSRVRFSIHLLHLQQI